MTEPSQQELRRLFTYSKEKGLLWSCPTSNGIQIFQKAGTDKPGRYSIIQIHGREYSLHRIAYIYHYGAIPSDKRIDHRDRDKSNNLIENLRLASLSQQQTNSLSRGFSYRKNRRRWVARLEKDKSKLYIGSYKTALQARLAYEKKGLELHGEFFPPCFFTEAVETILKGGDPPLNTSYPYKFLSN